MQKSLKSILVTYVMTIFIALLATACDSKPPKKTEKKVEVIGQNELCTTHQLSISDCFICDPALRNPGRLWCGEHNRYEDRCFICHPELKDENRLWCREHNLYEDECIFCHPELKKKQAEEDKKTVSANLNNVGNDLQCEEHGVLEKECGICHPELADVLQPGQGLKVRFESMESAKKAGIGFANPLSGKGLSDSTFLCSVSYNQNLFARITPLAKGVIQRVLADVGDTVTKGDVLVEILAPEIAKAKSEYLMALANKSFKKTVFKRKKELRNEQIASQGDYEMVATEYELAKSTAAAAYQKLLNYGFDNDDIAQIENTRSMTSMLQVLAPFSGTLIDRHAVAGESVEPGDITFKIADLSTMWLELSIPEDRSDSVSIGDTVEAVFDVLPQTRISGTITWISTGIDEKTRMLKGRAVVPNPDLKLKHSMFGQVHVVPKRLTTSLYVPIESLHRFGPERLAFVFTKLADDLFEARRVETGSKNGEYVEILKGLMPEDQVVAAHSFTVKSEFLKARLGAGCVDE